MNIVNLTPHNVLVWALCDLERYGAKFYPKKGTSPALTIPMSGKIARINESTKQASSVYFPMNISRDVELQVPIYEVGEKEIIDLPDSQPDTIYIVSSVVNLNVADRNDLIAPYGLVYDPDVRRKNYVIGCHSFIRRKLG